MSKMSKVEFLKAMVESGAYGTQVEAETAYSCVFGVLSEALRQGLEIGVSRFGTFRVRERQARIMNNPRTGKPMEVQASTSVAFKPSSKLLA